MINKYIYILKHLLKSNKLDQIQCVLLWIIYLTKCFAKTELFFLIFLGAQTCHIFINFVNLLLKCVINTNIFVQHLFYNINFYENNFT